MSQKKSGLGLSGRLAEKFLTTEITPLLALLGLLMGVFAVMVTPREEEPQINVTFANVFIPFPGASAQEVEQFVSIPAEQVLAEISGVEHVYSVSQPGRSVLTVQYTVGEPRTDAIVRLYNKIYSNQDWLSPALGVGQPIVKPMGIDDVPIVSFTLWSEDASGLELSQVAHSVEAELKRVDGSRDVYTLGGPEQVVHILLDPQKLAANGIALDQLKSALQAANTSFDAGTLLQNGREIQIQAGSFLSTPEAVAELVVGYGSNGPVYLSAVADVQLGADDATELVWFGAGPNGAETAPEYAKYPAATLAVAKKPGTNAVDIANGLIARMHALRGTLIPDNIHVELTRNYGETADNKAKKLIIKLVFATSVVVVLVGFALGFREAVVIGAAVVITLALTLFASWAWGFTLNRVSLFALIFSIGILVDDAIVVVENIHRHQQLGAKNLALAIPKAVDEVGSPTILATFTVIAALLPMAFVSGLMGPYMSPIPINASMGMIISLLVAFIITPWLCLKLMRSEAPHHAEGESKMQRFFTQLMTPFLRGRQGRLSRVGLMLGVLLLIAASVSLAVGKVVVLKMLPFDNKSEFQVLVDMPEGTSVEETSRVLDALSVHIASVPEVANYQSYAGTSAPINFNGLVRQYYLRRAAHMGDIQVNLVDKHNRNQQSHDIASAMRAPLQAIGNRLNANVKVVEVPPGPPVMSPIVAEVYGPDYAGQIKAAQTLRARLKATADVVDTDDTVEADAPRWIAHIDRQKAAHYGISQSTISSALATALAGSDVGALHLEHGKYTIPLRLELPQADKTELHHALALKLRGGDGQLVPISELVRLEQRTIQKSIYHKDLMPVVFVTADSAGELDSPLYSMFDLFFTLDSEDDAPEQYLIQQPADTVDYSIKWDGEWQITYETFRDMGLAYAVGMILIYLLVVAQFGSYKVPLIIMAPIPLTIIGVMPGHALFDAQFTATSMIGMIALAGIIVRNSILLVDFINEQVSDGMAFQKAVITAAAVRTKPIVLTALAAMLGAVFILDDPIFGGLAISLIFGIMVSTLLTLIIIPVLYYSAFRRELDPTA